MKPLTKIDQRRAEWEFQQITTKTPEERTAEALFHQLPKAKDGTVSLTDLIPPKYADDLNDLMYPQNTRRPK